MQKLLVILLILALFGCTKQPATPSRLPLVLEPQQPVKSYQIKIGTWNFGFQDIPIPRNSYPDPVIHMVHFGPLGSHGVTFTATQGFVGFCVTFLALLSVPVVALTLRWK